MRWRRGRWLLLLSAAVLLGLVATAWAATPASAQEIETGHGNAPGDSCVLRSDRIRVDGKDFALDHPGEVDTYFESNRLPYWYCDGSNVPKGSGCVPVRAGDLPDQNGWTGDTGVDSLCAANVSRVGDTDVVPSLLLRCRNEIAHSVDDDGGVLIPEDYAERGWAWWVEEIRYESFNVTERRQGRDEVPGDEIGRHKNADAKGCSLGSNPPIKFCAEVHEEREVKHRELIAAQEDGRSEDVERLNDEIDALTDTGGLIPDDCWGTLPTRNYKVTWAADDFSMETLTGWLATITFSFGKTVIGTALWLLGLAFTFDVTRYQQVASQFVEQFDTEVIHLGDRGNEFTLYQIAWFALFVYAGFQIFRNRVGRGLTEILISVAFATMASVFITTTFLPGSGTTAPRSHEYLSIHANGYFYSFADLVDRSSAAMLTLADNELPGHTAGDRADEWGINDDIFEDRITGDTGREFREWNLRQLLHASQSRIHDEFVERPYMLINYGDEVALKGDVDPADESNNRQDPYDISCAAAINNTLSTYYSGNGWEQRYLDRVTLQNPEAECGDLATFNGEMDIDRLMSAVFVVIVAIVVGVLLGLTASTLLVCKFLVAVLFMLLPIMLIAVILPGRGRKLTWWWLGALVQTWLGAFFMGLVLAMLVILLNAVHAGTKGMDLAERWGLVMVLIAILYFARKKLMAGSQGAAQAISDQLAGMNQGSGGVPWAGGGRGLKSLDLSQLSGDRAASGAGRWAATTGVALGGQYALAAAGGAAFSAFKAGGAPFVLAKGRFGEGRQAKKALRNLEKLDLTRRRRDLQQKQLGEKQKLASRQTKRLRRGLDTNGRARDTNLKPLHEAVATARRGLAPRVDHQVASLRSAAEKLPRKQRVAQLRRIQGAEREIMRSGPDPINPAGAQQRLRNAAGVLGLKGRDMDPLNQATGNLNYRARHWYQREQRIRQTERGRRAGENQKLTARHVREQAHWRQQAEAFRRTERGWGGVEGLRKEIAYQAAVESYHSRKNNAERVVKKQDDVVKKAQGRAEK